METNRRFMRTEALIGAEGVEKLQHASVMVVGLGAVGGYALEALARAGIGRLILVDFDVFDETNINRQILALSSTVGRRKTEVARERVLEINPDCRVEVCDLFVNRETIPQLLRMPVDFVVDAIDSLNAKCCLIEALQQAGIPFVSSMGAALKTDPSQIRLGSLAQTENCSLARLVRQRLRRRGVDLQRVLCVSSRELPRPVPDAKPQDGRERRPLGSLPTITAIFGLMMANEVICRLITAINDCNKTPKDIS